MAFGFGLSSTVATFFSRTGVPDGVSIGRSPTDVPATVAMRAE
jgi:hypothetical protein